MPSGGLNEMNIFQRGRGMRSGFTLIELMVVVVLMALIGTSLTLLLMRQQRFYRAVVSIADSRARMRDIANILPTDLRSISTSGADILAFNETSIQFRAFVGTSIVCNFPAAPAPVGQVIELPPRVLASGNYLTAWINPPGAGDIAYLYDDGPAPGNADDTWQRFAITDTVSATDATWCASGLTPAYTTAADAGARRFRITLGAAPNQAQVKRGAVVRFMREVRYSAYQAGDNQWYVGYQTCTPAGGNVAGVCGTIELLAGPVQPASTDTLTSGFFLVLYNSSGTRLTAVAATDTIARISVGIRTAAQSLRQATATKVVSITGGDSLRFVIGLRNRI